MWQFIRAFFGFHSEIETFVVELNNPPTTSQYPAQGTKRPAMSMRLEALEEQDQKREAELKREHEDSFQEQASKRRRFEAEESSPTSNDLHHQQIQALQAKLLAIQADPRIKAHGVSFREWTNILQPLLNKNENGNLDTWLSDTAVVDFIEYKIKHLNQQENIKICALHPVKMPENKLKRFTIKNKKATKIIWPILESRHFYLITIGYEDNQVYINALDGFNDKSIQLKYLNAARELANLLYPDADLQLVAPQIIFGQNNGIDCGVVVCYFADHFIQKSVSEFVAWLQTNPTPSDNPIAPYTPYREKIAEVMCEVANDVIKQTEASKPMALSTI
jgi:hypothetical protein